MFFTKNAGERLVWENGEQFCFCDGSDVGLILDIHQKTIHPCLVTESARVHLYVQGRQSDNTKRLLKISFFLETKSMLQLLIDVVTLLKGFLVKCFCAIFHLNVLDTFTFSKELGKRSDSCLHTLHLTLNAGPGKVILKLII